MGFEIDLELPETEILSVIRNEAGDYFIELKSTKTKGKCRQCGREINHFKGYDEWITIRHLPILDREVYLKIRPRRYQCFRCEDEPTTTEVFSWRTGTKPYTKAYQNHILHSLINSTIEDVCLKAKIGEKQVEAMLSNSEFANDPLLYIEKIGVLGLDEIALRKGHQSFVVIVSCQVKGQTRVLKILKDRKKETVVAYLQSIPCQLRQTIETVCTDMYEGYVNAVHEVLGEEQEIVIDRFHVAQAYRKGADCLRKQEQKRLKKELIEEDYKKLKGLLWAFRKNPNHLKSQELEILKRAFHDSPKLEQAYRFRNDLTTLFEENISKEEALRRFEQWIEEVRTSELNCFDSFIKTLSNFQQQIANYFHLRRSSGFVEGMNNKIKVIKRRCYGIFNIQHLQQRILLDTWGRQRLIMSR